MKKTLSIIVSLLLIFSTVLNVRAFETNQIENTSNEVVEDNTNDSSINEDDLQDADQNGDTEIVDDNENSENNNTKGNDEITNQVTTNLSEEVITPKVMYKTHVQDYGWSNYISEGVTGTVGKSKRLEAIKMKLDLGSYEGSIEYSTHIQDIGWTSYVSDDQLSGTEGKSKRLEAIKIKLVGDIANYYDVYYRVHIQDNGWLDWACNGASAGSETYGKRLEGIEIKLIKKGDQVPENTQNPFIYPGHIYYSTHVQDYGWLSNVGDGSISGTLGKSKRIEALKVSLCNLPYSGNVEYSAHVQSIGWQSYRQNGSISGTSGQSKRIEAIKIRLTGDIANYYDVYYRVHVQNFGWLDWTSNDSIAGTTNLSLRVEAIQIQLVEKGQNAPGSTGTPYKTTGNVSYRTHVQDIGWQSYVKNGNTSGTTNQSRRLEAIQIQLDDNNYSGAIEYSAHIQDIGWQSWVSNNSLSGTVNQSKRLEAIKIRLTGDIANYYDVYYRVHAQEYGWLGWAANGQLAGTSGFSYRLEAIQIQLVPKGANSISTSNNSFYDRSTSGNYYIIKNAAGNIISKKLFTGYNIQVDRSAHRVYVRNNADNVIVKTFACTVGASSTPTITGNYAIYTKRLYFDSGSSRCWYFSPFKGGYGFHSVLYYQSGSPAVIKDGRLGLNLSHGCIRLNVNDAKWIYDNCGISTAVHIYN